MATLAFKPLWQPDFITHAVFTGGKIGEQDPPPPPPDPGDIAGLDLCAHSIGLTVAYWDVADESIRSQTTTDWGLTAAWSAIIASPGDADDLSAPSLATATNDDIYVAWHDAAGAIYIQRSGDYGRTWSASITTSPILAGKHPRILITKERQYIALWDLTAELIKLYGSTDFYETVTLLASAALGEQAISLREDRRGNIHIAYESGANIAEQITADGLTWGSPVTLISSRMQPTAGYASAAGAVFAWNTGDVLEIRRTDGAYDSIEAGPVTVTTAYPQQVPGVCVDRRGIVWLALFPQTGGFTITDDLGRLAPDSPQFAIDQGGGMGMF